MNAPLNRAQRDELRRQLRNELTEALVYAGLARRLPAGHNRDLLTRLAADERRHADQLAALLGEAGRPDRLRAARTGLVARCAPRAPASSPACSD